MNKLILILALSSFIYPVSSSHEQIKMGPYVASFDHNNTDIIKIKTWSNPWEGTAGSGVSYFADISYNNSSDEIETQIEINKNNYPIVESLEYEAETNAEFYRDTGKVTDTIVDYLTIDGHPGYVIDIMWSNGINTTTAGYRINSYEDVTIRNLPENMDIIETFHIKKQSG